MTSSTERVTGPSRLPWRTMLQLHFAAQQAHVDDDQDDHEIFSMALSSVNPSIQCIYFDSAKSALCIMEDENFRAPDYIFLDLNMPGINGLQLLEILKTTKDLAAIPVIIYSTSILPADYEKARLLGATGFLIKPSSLPELIKELNQILQ